MPGPHLGQQEQLHPAEAQDEDSVAAASMDSGTAALLHAHQEHDSSSPTNYGPADSTEEPALLLEQGPVAVAAARRQPSFSGWWVDDRWRSMTCVNLSCIMERVDEQLLPALYRFVGGAFHADPEQMGALTFSRAVVQALASPAAGMLGHHFNRVYIICAGAGVWGLMCTLFATTHSVAQGIPFWALNGIGLALLIPAAQSLVADYNDEQHRGRAFGLLHLTGAVGALLGALFATNIGATRPLGMEGWRFAFVCVAVASWLIGLLTLLLAVDPRDSRDPRYRVQKASDLHTGSSGWRGTLQQVGSVVTIPTFLIIVLQGIVGSTPWSALVFATLYLQLLGMSDLQASLLVAAFLAANAAGGLLGGFLGDWAARRWPNHGRIFVCQLSVSAGVPLSFLLFKSLPLHAGTLPLVLYASVLVVTGLVITWAATACINPIFAEIVPPHLRNMIYAFDRSFEGAVAALGAPLVGRLAKSAFGFSGTTEVSTTDLAGNKEKAHSLGSALLVFTAVPWTLCAIFFTGLHWTYPRDKRRAVQQAAEAGLAALAAQALLASTELAVVLDPQASEDAKLELNQAGRSTDSAQQHRSASDAAV